MHRQPIEFAAVLEWEEHSTLEGGPATRYSAYPTMDKPFCFPDPVSSSVK